MERPSSASLLMDATAADLKVELVEQMRGHEVAVAEISYLSPSRAVYQKQGNLYFRTSAKKAKAYEQSSANTECAS